MPTIRGVFDALRDPARWARVEITDRWRALVWHLPDGEDVILCADALYLTATNATFTPSTAAE